ncbi:MAG: DUF1674 domain-containing protein [Gammaproteobacteria bacterium]|nr:DUF1674 domain-containing protein [Gammaproteobacteria bacterium]
MSAPRDGYTHPFSGKIRAVISTDDHPPGGVPADPATEAPSTHAPTPAPRPPREVGGRDGPDPTRYGDWELRGRCIDF